MCGIQVLVQTRAQLIAARRARDTATGKDGVPRRKAVCGVKEGRAWAGLGYSSESSASALVISQFASPKWVRGATRIIIKG
jgi:hypothetical protein